MNTEETIFVYDELGKLIAEYSTDIAPSPQTKCLTEDYQNHHGCDRTNYSQKRFSAVW